jgi:hypothetical protein
MNISDAQDVTRENIPFIMSKKENRPCSAVGRERSSVSWK